MPLCQDLNMAQGPMWSSLKLSEAFKETVCSPRMPLKGHWRRATIHGNSCETRLLSQFLQLNHMTHNQPEILSQLSPKTPQEMIVDIRLKNNLYANYIRNTYRAIRKRQASQQYKGQHARTGNSQRRRPKWVRGMREGARLCDLQGYTN